MLLENPHSSLSSYEYYFGKLKDPRDSRGLLHSLHDILIIAIVSVICGADDFTEMEDFGKSKEPFLKELFILSSWNSISRYLWASFFTIVSR